ncbi:MAG TPA: zinc-dependent alcohol dehydrogenase family protein [Steroidobacteraceae bacterium]|nr:zinc-dependent alcohol dehydrogenase family protein [Steroidobacteraceae bacterium]
MPPPSEFTAQAMRLAKPHAPLTLSRVSLAPPADHEVLLEVSACGVCRTDLHLLDGELAQANYPVTPGHELVGRVCARGARVTVFEVGERVGVPWLAHSCGRCFQCRVGAENLCDHPAFTGCNVDGGYATHALADGRFCLRIPARYADAEAAPLLCAGLIGYRAYRACGEARSLGLYGFGAAAHLLAQVAMAQGRRVFAFTRPGDIDGQNFARQLGVWWAGGSDESPPQALDAAILLAPVGALVPAALAAVRKGGRVVCAGIHMSDIPAFPYDLLWGERSVSSVANLTRADGHEFMRLAAQLPLRPAVECFPLEKANEALSRLRAGTLRGAAVLTMNSRENPP